MSNVQLGGDSSYLEAAPRWGVVATAPTEKGLRQWQKSVEAGGGFKVKLVKAFFHRGYDLMVFRQWWYERNSRPGRHHTTKKGARDGTRTDWKGGIASAVSIG